MCHSRLSDLPGLRLPEGLTIRAYREGDAVTWKRINGDVFGWERAQRKLDRLMKADESFRPERVLFLLCHDEPRAANTGHGGSDLMVLVAFVNAVLGKSTVEIGIHEAMDMTLPGLISQQSFDQDGTWLDVPDSRTW